MYIHTIQNADPGMNRNLPAPYKGDKHGTFKLCKKHRKKTLPP